MTQTEAPIQDPEEARDDGHGAAPAVDDHHDPLHDIDGFKTTAGVLGTLLVVVLLIWAMSHLFNLMTQVERQAKIANTPTTEFNEVRAESVRELQGKNPARGSKTIEQAMRELAK